MSLEAHSTTADTTRFSGVYGAGLSLAEVCDPLVATQRDIRGQIARVGLLGAVTYTEALRSLGRTQAWQLTNPHRRPYIAHANRVLRSDFAQSQPTSGGLTVTIAHTESTKFTLGSTGRPYFDILAVPDDTSYATLVNEKRDVRRGLDTSYERTRSIPGKIVLARVALETLHYPGGISITDVRHGLAADLGQILNSTELPLDVVRFYPTEGGPASSTSLTTVDTTVPTWTYDPVGADSGLAASPSLFEA
ncbi:MAG TPA: hypothetical protein VMB52_06755 [Verrucomicrobiae bacterium]|nr:hypothetical protein [Verrucomicrobiae bacterium]